MHEWNLPESPPPASNDLLVGDPVPAYLGAAQAQILQTSPPPRTREHVEGIHDALRYVDRYDEWRPRILDWSAAGLQDIGLPGTPDCFRDVQDDVGCRHSSLREGGMHPRGPVDRKQTI